MILVGSESGQSFQKFQPDEVRPDRDIYLPQLFALARERYGFLGASDIATARDGGAKFQNGIREIGGRQIAVQALEIYNDGLIVRCRNTDDADFVVDDAIEWIIQTFGVKRAKTIYPRLHQSHLIVDFDIDLGKGIRRFEAITKLMATAFERANPHASGKFDIYRFAFAIDPQTLPLHTTTGFILERRANTPYSTNRYYCMAPLNSHDHVRLLEDIERLWAGSVS